MAEEKKIKAFFCPKCRSVNVYHPFKVSNLFGLIPKWKCRACGFEGVQFPLLTTTKKALDKKTKKKTNKNKGVKK